MSKVMTVRGPVEANQLKNCQCHEHLTPVEAPSHATIGVRREMVEKLVPQLKAMRKNHGCNAIIDCTCDEVWGRDVRTLQWLAELSDMHIIASTGFLTALRTPWWLKDISEEKLTEFWIKEAGEGLDGTAIRPGVFKAGICGAQALSLKNPEYPLVKKLHRAIGRAHQATGLPVTTHSPYGACSEGRHLKLLMDCGIPPAKCAFGHADTANSVEELVPVVSKGAYVLLNFCGGFKDEEPYFKRAVTLIIGLVGAGYTDRILLSVDAVMRTRFAEGIVMPASRTYAHTFTHVVPALLAAGISQETIVSILQDNPVSYLS